MSKTLGRISQMKTELFANVSHEMKTPLTVISVHIQRAEAFMKLGGEKSNAKVYESFALVQEEIMRLSRMVEGALSVASMQELTQRTEVTNVREILIGNIEAYRALSDKQGNTLSLAVPDTLPDVTVSADALVQMITNLLANANAHTQNGVITVCVECGGETLKISVADNGTGIPPDILPHVFERGVTDGSGSGFGLAICRELVRSCGGDVVIHSEYGKGTTAAITLPAGTEDKDNG